VPMNCPHPGSAMLTALHVADCLSAVHSGYDAELHHSEPDLEYLSSMELSGRLPEWRELALQIAKQEASSG